MLERREVAKTLVLSDSLVFCCGDLSEEYDFVGNDSIVYRFGEKIVKVYNQGEWKYLSTDKTAEIIGLYRNITNQASFLAEKENWQLHLPYNRLVLPFRVAPIEKIIRCSCCGSFASVCPFVEGKKLNDLFDLKELKLVLPNLSSNLNQRFSVLGISIVPVNLKYDQGKIIVTDLCSQVSLLNRRLVK